MRVRTFALTLMMLAGGQVAHAADLAPTVEQPLAPVVAPFSWTGFYIGLNAGYGWGAPDPSV